MPSYEPATPCKQFLCYVPVQARSGWLYGHGCKFSIALAWCVGKWRHGLSLLADALLVLG